ncbi:hypothetical protein DYBT9275_02638 [Dyadobacter sp. CECT 9275]|uniref:Uncharacterized protein n=1 Tax=Dyadobacter helix TaxID=2822344 RepID=A0A916JD05_9BACT|nr:hypothetical protein DYBT9275_02638 [Dyadobacter sp. CECT 9275]
MGFSGYSNRTGDFITSEVIIDTDFISLAASKKEGM